MMMMLLVMKIFGAAEDRRNREGAGIVWGRLHCFVNGSSSCNQKPSTVASPTLPPSQCSAVLFALLGAKTRMAVRDELPKHVCGGCGRITCRWSTRPVVDVMLTSDRSDAPLRPYVMLLHADDGLLAETSGPLLGLLLTVSFVVAATVVPKEKSETISRNTSRHTNERIT
jgi:hypothetical protein